MTDRKPLEEFVAWCGAHIKGDEKGEAQIFLDHFFVALGFKDGFKGAGADCEYRIRNEEKRSTNFADLVWQGRVLIEMKKRGEDLSLHLQQAVQYWQRLRPHHGRYIILCNFDQFWIYDTEVSLYNPADVVELWELPERYMTLAFLFPVKQVPQFHKNREDVTKSASYLVAAVFKSLTKRKIPAEHALRFCMQTIIALFAEDVDLLPNGLFSQLIDEALEGTKNQGYTGGQVIPVSYDLIGGLFEAMNKPGLKGGGRYKGVDYFNGGLFNEIYPIELTLWELQQLHSASKKNWRNVNPAIFGSIFEDALDKDERHVLGAHYTHEQDIKKIVDPCIVEPWSEKLEATKTLEDMRAWLTELCQYRVLDPACGSGNFLFVAFKEMKMLEKRGLAKLRALGTSRESGKELQTFLDQYPFVNSTQFYGLDIKPFAVELAKVTLMVAKELSWLDNKESYDNKFTALPLDNLDENIVCRDALVNPDGSPTAWPEAEVIVGNPPYQARSKMLSEFGADYMNKLWAAYPAMNRYADFCTYWFYKAHLQLKENQRAGLVGTNTIRQNNSRESSLEFIVNNKGEIFNAYSSLDWAGEAAVFVSIVNWIKGSFKAKKRLWVTEKDTDPPVEYLIERINPSLSLRPDVSIAKPLQNVTKNKLIFKGQKHGHEGFLVKLNKAKELLLKNPENREVLKPYMTGDELVSKNDNKPNRYLIDFTRHDIVEASAFMDLFKIISETVLPKRQSDAEKEIKQNEDTFKKNPKARAQKSYQQYLKTWWQPIGKREDLLDKFDSGLFKYIACSEVTLRPIFEFVSSEIRPNATLNVFTLLDDYSFGIIQSCFHWEWFTANCSSLGTTFRYTNESVWDTFPWPQNLTEKQIEAVAQAALALRLARREAMAPKGSKPGMSLRDLYRLLELPGKNPIKDLHHALDKAVAEAYGLKTKLEYSEGIYLKDPNPVLEFLLALNLEVAEKEANKEPVQGPGLPDWVKNKERFVSEDCVKWEG